MTKQQKPGRAKIVILLSTALVAVNFCAFQVGRWLFPDHRREAAIRQITSFSDALEMYQSDTGHFPTTDAGVDALVINSNNDPNWRGPYLHNTMPPLLDPWGHPYKYANPGPLGEPYFISTDAKVWPISTETIKPNQ